MTPNMNFPQTRPIYSYPGRERYYVVAGRQLDAETNNGTDGYIARQSAALKITLAKILVVVFICSFVNILGWSGVSSGIPAKIVGVKQDISIQDDAGILGNTDALMNSIDEYYNLAGVSTVIRTVYDEDWKDTYADLNAYAASLEKSISNSSNAYIMVISVSKADLEQQRPVYTYGYCCGGRVSLVSTRQIQDDVTLEISDALAKDMNAGAALNSGLKTAIDATTHRVNPTLMERSMILLRHGWPIVLITVISIALVAFIIVKYVKERKAWIEDAPKADPRLA